MKRWGKVLAIVAVAMMVVSVAAFAAPKTWVVGFSQIGSESEWRTADTDFRSGCDRAGSHAS